MIAYIAANVVIMRPTNPDTCDNKHQLNRTQRT